VEESNKGEAEVQAEEESLMEMLNEMVPLAEAALQTNETISVFVDDLSNLGDEETLGNTSDNKIKEYSSPFTDINYSKNTIISAIDWMPDSKGTVAVACVDKSSMDEQVEMDGKVRTSHILIWNFRDPIHPQFVLKAPGDIHSFKFNPDNNDLLAAGCANGQVLYWDLKAAKSALAKKDQKEMMACFSVGHQLGAVGTAFMCAAAEQAPGFIDANTGEDMEDLLDKEQVKQDIIAGKLKPLGQEHVYHVFPRDKK